MSKFYSSRSAPSKSSIPQFKTKAEAENWFAPYGKLNAEGLRAQGGSIIDMNTFVPDKNVTTEFQCTPHLRGLLYPCPGTYDLYMLEFVDRSGKRVNVTNLTIYDVGNLGDGEREMIYPMGTVPGVRGTVDLYTLNPGSVVEICQNDQTVLNTISFIYSGRGYSHAKPCIE